MHKGNANKMILEDIQKKILSGEYALGERLPDERSLADYYEVSRIPVREALKVLAENGAVETKRGSGTYVKSNANIILSGGDKEPFLKADQVLRETITVRRILEPEAAALAAINANKDELDRLEKILISTITEIRKLKSGEENHFFEVDYEFHLTIAELSHNSIFPECLKAMRGLMAAHQYWSLRMTSPLDEVISYHSAIFENILLHNDKGAKEAMAGHIGRVESLITNDNVARLENFQMPQTWHTT